MNRSKKNIVIATLSVLIFISILVTSYFVFQTIQLKKQISEIKIETSIVTDSRCVEKKSLNCSDISELTYECSDEYQSWALDNCPNWNDDNLEFSSGWYWGTIDQKKPNTPSDWVYQEAGRSSC